MPRFFYRMPGEILRHDARSMWWRCPEISVCGTYVTEEFVARRGTA